LATEADRCLGAQRARPARTTAALIWLRRQRHWLVVEPLPGYAPDLNPVEALWSNLIGVELVNLAGDTLCINRWRCTA
jgi:hypothetical protein